MKQIRAKQREFRPKRSLGQNFLTDDALCSRLSDGALERVRKFSTPRVLSELSELYFDE